MEIALWLISIVLKFEWEQTNKLCCSPDAKDKTPISANFKQIRLKSKCIEPDWEQKKVLFMSCDKHRFGQSDTHLFLLSVCFESNVKKKNAEKHTFSRIFFGDK